MGRVSLTIGLLVMLISCTDQPKSVSSSVVKPNNPIRNRDSTTVIDTLSLPDLKDKPILAMAADFVFDSIILYQLCWPPMVECEYKIDMDYYGKEHSRSLVFYKKKQLNRKSIQQLTALISKNKYYSSRGPESTCATKYLFLSYKLGKINGHYSVDDCFMTSRNYLTNAGIKQLKDIVTQSGLKFVFYFGPEPYK